MAFVLDASVAACWAFDDEDHPLAARALERLRTEPALVPALCRIAGDSVSRAPAFQPQAASSPWTR